MPYTPVSTSPHFISQFFCATTLSNLGGMTVAFSQLNINIQYLFQDGRLVLLIVFGIIHTVLSMSSSIIHSVGLTFHSDTGKALQKPTDPGQDQMDKTIIPLMTKMDETTVLFKSHREKRMTISTFIAVVHTHL